MQIMLNETDLILVLNTGQEIELSGIDKIKFFDNSRLSFIRNNFVIEAMDISEIKKIILEE